MSLVCLGRAPAASSLARVGWIVSCLLAGSLPQGARAQAAAEPPAAASGTSANVSVDASSDEFARQVFQAGKAAYAIGNYNEALKYFQQAYELSGRAALLYNIGQAADRLRLEETALSALRKYLQQVPDASNRMEVAERIKVLQGVVQARRENQLLDSPLAEATKVPTPEQTAQAAQPPPTAAATVPVADSGSDDAAPITSHWWFWAGTGAVVVAVVVTVIAVGSGGGETVRDPLVGSNGKAVATLRVAP